MYRVRFLMLVGLAVVMAALPWGIGSAYGNAGPAGTTFYANSPSGGTTGTAMRKFVDSLPGLGAANANNLGQFIPVAVPDTTTYPGSDYYQIGITEHTEKMHSDLPKATRLRAYVDLGGAAPHQSWGPMIVAKRDRPVRIKFTNMLGIGAAGNLFIPVDGTIMGAGMGPDGMTSYTQNRTAVHLHGGFTPWISDGTPHQWFTPAGEAGYTQGVSLQNVPDMPNPGAGSNTIYYPNQQSARLMFYHDHAWGITRLNVYAGVFAAYLITDPVEDNLIATGVIPNNGGGVYNYGIPLIIQDKTFVPQDIATQDSKWDTANWGAPGDLWFPHVYEPNQTLAGGMNDYGRWDFGPWVWPNITAPVKKAANALPGTTADNPAGYNKSAVPESFMDTPIVNGCAYPYLAVQPTAYRFRVLNACNDRYLNLQLYRADTGGGGTGAFATVNLTATSVGALALVNPGMGYTTVPTVTIASTAVVAGGTTGEVKMIPAIPTAGFPDTWPTDGRAGGVPDPATAGPGFIQIGSEGGFLPGVAEIPNQPVNYDYDRRSVTVLNVTDHALYMGPAERADVIIDFSQYAGKTLILYNDAPAPMPGFDPRYDYYTGDPDFTAMGGAPSTLPGYGPNTRTIMQIQVAAGTGTPFNRAALNTALPTAYVASQPPPIVPETFYPAPYNAATDTFGTIFGNSLTFTPVGSTTPKTQNALGKAIIELFDDYGRMNATLGTEITDWTAVPAASTGYGFPYIDPPFDIFKKGEAQIWKITHNGVDTHAIHFHLVNVQLINRVGWDGVVKPPDPNERGWKETIRMNPLSLLQNS